MWLPKNIVNCFYYSLKDVYAITIKKSWGLGVYNVLFNVFYIVIEESVINYLLKIFLSTNYMPDIV